MAIKINPKLKPEALKQDFQTTGRLHIHDFLEPKDADTLHDLVAGCKLFKFKYNDGDKEVWVDPLELKSMPDPQMQDMVNKVFNSAMARNFQYTYYACPLSKETLKANQALSPFKEVVAFLGGKDLKAFIKALGGGDYKNASAEAIWHKTDSFQTTGDGQRKGENRLFGFSLDLSRDWDADWGGNRFFRGKKGEVEEVYPSAFNSLTLFKVPTRQSLATVTGYSKGLLLSISGWFLAD